MPIIFSQSIFVFWALAFIIFIKSNYWSNHNFEIWDKALNHPQLKHTTFTFYSKKKKIISNETFMLKRKQVYFSKFFLCI